MGCNCGGARTGKHYLVTMHDGGGRRLFGSEVDARIAVTGSGGGGWVEVDAEQYRALVAEGVPVS